ncbi:hypothetical protein AKJ54_00250 [candidate division MSBL1 archaeon SCGC-AAA382K21]|uniref:Uncharacterized protein n=1 Tax=candidate division MSBL1 archaeon SCGC-AAA382K21 TaxID=1698283 RepID=A0A133VM41_9EURY|nr:hypothetical protein AKJ54_00250 [candidate division MSBL1 archaeon SCGC-AAA382K21]
MANDVFSLNEIRDYLTAFKEIFDEIDEMNDNLSINIAHPRLNPRVAEDLCYHKHDVLFPDSIEARKVSSTHPDLKINFPDEELNVEIKSTVANFQDIGADMGCDALVWVNFRDYVKRDGKIMVFILDNTSGKLEQHVEEKKGDYARPTRINLKEFQKISTREVSFEITEEEKLKKKESKEDSNSEKISETIMDVIKNSSPQDVKNATEKFMNEIMNTPEKQNKRKFFKKESEENSTNRKESPRKFSNKKKIEKVADNYLPSRWKKGKKKKKQILNVIIEFLKQDPTLSVKKRR